MKQQSKKNNFKNWFSFFAPNRLSEEKLILKLNLYIHSSELQVLRHIVPINCPKLLLPFEEALVVIDDQNKIEVFEVETGELIIEIESTENFAITSVVHPITYMNQVNCITLWSLYSVFSV